ncbi:UNVERIFIED_CONTAM: hypothetical protein FKN15_043207 [Acipenser sinensis]
MTGLLKQPVTGRDLDWPSDACTRLQEGGRQYRGICLPVTAVTQRVSTHTLPHVVSEWDSLALPKQSRAPTNGAEMDAAMMDLLRQTLTAAVQGATRLAGPDPRLQRSTKMTADDRPEAYLEVFEAMATSAG